MANTTYAEKLKDPRWQKMRLKILERDGWKCQLCDDTTNTLVVHHKYYERGKEPWNYPDNAYVSLCQDCHEGAEIERLLSNQVIAISSILIWDSIRCDYCQLYNAIGEKETHKEMLKLLMKYVYKENNQ